MIRSLSTGISRVESSNSLSRNLATTGLGSPNTSPKDGHSEKGAQGRLSQVWSRKKYLPLLRSFPKQW